MVASADLRQQPSSDNPFVAGLLGEMSFRQGYVISVALQADAGDGGAYGGSRWAADGAKDAFIQAAQAWSAVANVTINVVADNYEGSANSSAYTWVESLGELEIDQLGEHSLPGTGALFGKFNDQVSVFTSEANQRGGYSFLTFVHEIGHGLGLTHPFDGPAKFPGVSGPDSFGENELNSLTTTVMTYNEVMVQLFSPNPAGDPSNTALTNFLSPSNDYGWAATPMAFDIAAIQLLYGANMSSNAGDDVYSLIAENGAGTYWQAIWDAGGVDTISAADSATFATIDLRPASLRNEPGGGGWLSRVTGIYGGFTIANGVIIERAIGSEYSDLITGNDAANILVGGAGADQIWGGNGDDVINGGDGDDAIWGGDGADTLIAGAGVDALFGDAGNDHITGGDGAERLSGGDGDDVIEGGGGDDDVQGEAGADTLAGGGGNDTLNGGIGIDRMTGGAGDDVYYVDMASDQALELDKEGRDTVRSSVNYVLAAFVEELHLTGAAVTGTGNSLDNAIWGGDLASTIYGGSGNDRLVGGNASDKLQGDSGNDEIIGNKGADIIYGGEGDDVLVGDLGVDEIHGGDGNDRIYGGERPFDMTASEDDGADHQSEDQADVLFGDAGNDIIYLEGYFHYGPNVKSVNGEWVPNHYSTHVQIDGGDGEDTMAIASEVEFHGKFTSIERIYFAAPPDSLPDMFGPQGHLILEGKQVDLIQPQTAFGGRGALELRLDATASFDGSSWSFDSDSVIAIHITGGSGDNKIIGTNQSDQIDGRTGNDTLLGGEGMDTAIFSGKRGDYQVTAEGDGYRITDRRTGINDGSDYADGIERFQFAGDTILATDILAGVGVPTSDRFRVYTSDGFAGSFGGSGQVVGTAAAQDVAVLDLPGSVAFDPSFNRGQDIIRLSHHAGDWEIMRLGSSAVFVDGDTFVRVPVGAAGLAIVFDDGALELKYDLGKESFMIGDQAFGSALKPITSQTDGTIVPVSIDTDAYAQLFLSAGSDTSAGGIINIFGTNASESVVVVSGEATLDPSFSKGNDSVFLVQPASAFMASRVGSTVILDSGNTTVRIPIGTSGMTVSFDGDDRTLAYDTLLGSVVIGEQQISTTPSALMAFG